MNFKKSTQELRTFVETLTEVRWKNKMRADSITEPWERKTTGANLTASLKLNMVFCLGKLDKMFWLWGIFIKCRAASAEVIALEETEVSPIVLK